MDLTYLNQVEAFRVEGLVPGRLSDEEQHISVLQDSRRIGRAS